MPMLLPSPDVEVRYSYVSHEYTEFGCIIDIHRQGGSGKIYAYTPEFDKNTQPPAVPPRSHGNHQFGFSVGRSAFAFPLGRWVTIAAHGAPLPSSLVTPLSAHDRASNGASYVNPCLPSTGFRMGGVDWGAGARFPDSPASSQQRTLVWRSLVIVVPVKPVH